MNAKRVNLVDISVFEQYRDVMGDETDDFIREIVQAFIKSSEELSAILMTSYETADVKTFHRTVHSLKSSLKTVGANSVAEKFAHLEALSSFEELDFPLELVSEARLQLLAVCQELNSYYE